MNIFELIKNFNEPTAPRPIKSVPSLLGLLLAYKLNKTPLTTTKLILYLKPTILSALHSYVPGQLALFRTRATILAINSLQNYNKDSKASLKTYVFTNLQRLNRLRRLRLNIIHIPLNQVYMKNIIDSKSESLKELLGREPTELLLSDALGMSKKKLNKLMSSFPNATISGSASLNLLGHLTLGNKDLTDRDYYLYVYSSVDPIDKKIMLWSSGFSKKLLSNNLIAKNLKISPGAVSQRKNKIQQKISLVRGLL